MPSTDRHAPFTAPTERITAVPESTIDPATAESVRQLLEGARLVESAFETTPAAPAAPASPAVPVPPPGYTLKTVHHTSPDGGSRVEYEVVPLAPLTGPTVPAGTGTQTATRSLPDWLTSNRRKVKAAFYLSAGGTVAAGAALYGPAVGAGISAAAAGVWAATVLVLKVVGIALGGLLVLRVLCGGKGKKRSGTFEFSGTGTWKEN
ncbi:hypothetical protein [Streptomyces sp. NPDC001930]|uniref:hypothetical protein n=1 Tax=Streptomyces sp. NPDC001930 TaxID=3364625 RepID=UPI0036805810